MHWMIWNIPGDVDWLPEGIADSSGPVTPQGAVQGKNDNGSLGYFGPRPPAGTGVHHYHFQIFALDGPLTLQRRRRPPRPGGRPAGPRHRHGELVGTYAAPE